MRVERGHIGIALEGADLGRIRELADPFDQLFPHLPVGDEIRDGDAFEAVRRGEPLHLGAAHHGAVVVHELRQYADRRQAGEPAQIDARLGMAGAHQHPALARHQRKDMAGADEVGGATVGIGERPHRVGALLSRNAGGQSVADIDRDREGGAEGRIVQGHHGIKMQALRFLRRQRHAHDARGVADDEGHLLGRAPGSGDEQVAFVLAIIVVGHHDDLAAPEGSGDLLDVALGFTGCHWRFPDEPITSPWRGEVGPRKRAGWG